MDNILDSTLSSILERLANFFGTTIAEIKGRLPAFLQAYARFAFFSNLPQNLLFGFLIGALFVGIFLIFLFIVEGEDSVYSKGLIQKKSHIVAIIFLIILGVTISIGISVGKLLAYPEMYAIKDLLADFNNTSR